MPWVFIWGWQISFNEYVNLQIQNLWIMRSKRFLWDLSIVCQESKHWRLGAAMDVPEQSTIAEWQACPHALDLVCTQDRALLASAKDRIVQCLKHKFWSAFSWLWSAFSWWILFHHWGAAFQINMASDYLTKFPEMRQSCQPAVQEAFSFISKILFMFFQNYLETEMEWESLLWEAPHWSKAGYWN